MTRQEALRQADSVIEQLLANGDEAIFNACRGPDGRIDQMKVVAAAMSAREKLADQYMAEAEGKAG
jgi:uncharacterized protein YqhQ